MKRRCTFLSSKLNFSSNPCQNPSRLSQIRLTYSKSRPVLFCAFSLFLCLNGLSFCSSSRIISHHFNRTHYFSFSSGEIPDCVWTPEPEPKSKPEKLKVQSETKQGQGQEKVLTRLHTTIKKCETGKESKESAEFLPFLLSSKSPLIHIFQIDSLDLSVSALNLKKKEIHIDTEFGSTVKISAEIKRLLKILQLLAEIVSASDSASFSPSKTKREESKSRQLASNIYGAGIITSLILYLQNLLLYLQNFSGANSVSYLLMIAFAAGLALIGAGLAIAYILGPGALALLTLLIPLTGFGLLALPMVYLQQISLLG